MKRNGELPKKIFSLNNKVEYQKKHQFDKHPQLPLVNHSYFDEYMKNHPMEKKVHENEKRFHTALDKNKLNVQSNYIKQKISLLKNIESNISKK